MDIFMSNKCLHSGVAGEGSSRRRKTLQQQQQQQGGGGGEPPNHIKRLLKTDIIMPAVAEGSVTSCLRRGSKTGVSNPSTTTNRTRSLSMSHEEGGGTPRNRRLYQNTSMVETQQQQQQQQESLPLSVFSMTSGADGTANDAPAPESYQDMSSASLLLLARQHGFLGTASVAAAGEDSSGSYFFPPRGGGGGAGEFLPSRILDNSMMTGGGILNRSASTAATNLWMQHEYNALQARSTSELEWLVNGGGIAGHGGHSSAASTLLQHHSSPFNRLYHQPRDSIMAAMAAATATAPDLGAAAVGMEQHRHHQQGLSQDSSMTSSSLATNQSNQLQNSWDMSGILRDDDRYAKHGILGPWSARSASLLGSMAISNNPDNHKRKRIRKDRPKDKPKRPLSAYNIFFKEERTRILEEPPRKKNKTMQQTKKQKMKKSEDDDDDATATTTKNVSLLEEEEQQPEENSVLSSTDILLKNTKNAGGIVRDTGILAQTQKQPHGKIGFESLAKAIGRRWQDLNPEQVEYYKKKADIDMQRYKDDMKKYTENLNAKADAAAAAAATSKNDDEEEEEEDDDGEEEDTTLDSSSEQKQDGPPKTKKLKKTMEKVVITRSKK